MKGVEPRTMMSQMFAKTTGLSKGRDSALHSGVTELGIFGNTSMLGANLPVAAGLGLTFKMEKLDHVVVAYFGEGASNTGDFPRGAELRRRAAAADRVHLREQPVRLLGARSRRAWRSTMWRIRAEGYGSTASRSTATTCSPSTGIARRDRARARRRRPTLIECKTYRWHGHSSTTRRSTARRRARDVEEPRSIPTFTTYLQRATCSTIRS
jgi:TPP-dependent pyruvate/acetoin dehydrogenase alpha subunit